MSFTFNWAGVNVPNIVNTQQNWKDRIVNDFGNAGAATKGYFEDKANKEYADILDGRNRITQIKSRIAQLQARNREIMQQLAGTVQTAVEPQQAYVPVDASAGQPANYPYSNNV